MRQKSFRPEIFLLAFASLLLEISYTRVFSFKLTAHYTYLIIGFALLGIGGGGVLVALLPGLRQVSLARLFAGVCAAGATAVGLGYVIVARIELSTYKDPTSPEQLALLLLVCGVLFASFLPLGLLVAALFALRPAEVPRLYFADLAGAGLGCAAAIPLIGLLSPPGCIFASAAALALAGALAGATSARPLPGSASARPLAGLCAALALGMGGLALAPGLLPEVVVDPTKTLGRETMKQWGLSRAFHRWSPVFRVDVLDSALSDEGKWLAHDGLFGSSIRAFDGDLESVHEHYDASDRKLPFSLLGGAPRVLIIGSAGGNEILASLRFGAEHVTGVELNPVTVSLLRDHFADYTGRIAERDDVTLVNAEGRSFLERDPSRYDLIYFVAPDSYAAMNAAQASSFVLVESYLYTKEMVAETLRHLNPGGVVCMQFGEVDYTRKPRRTSRYLATARAALAERGITDFERHVLVATTRDHPFQLSTILLGAEPFSEEQIGAFLAAAESLPRSEARHAWGRVREPGAAGRVIELPEPQLEAFLASYEYDVGPVSDDAPFFWHFVRFRDVLTGASKARVVVTEDGRGEIALVTMLAVSAAFAAVALFSPFLLSRQRFSRLPGKLRASVYFAGLGMGFMFFEVCLIQKLTLFLGYPTYSLTVTLAALLVFSGLGSLASDWYVERRDAALPVLLVALAALTVFYRSGLDPMVNALLGLPLPLRVGAAVAMLAPLGLCLGAFMPLGLATVSRSTDDASEYVAWAWAANGFFSVMGAILATMISMSYGFRALLVLALAVYVVAAIALRALPLGPSASGTGEA